MCQHSLGDCDLRLHNESPENSHRSSLLRSADHMATRLTDACPLRLRRLPVAAARRAAATLCCWCMRYVPAAVVAIIALAMTPRGARADGVWECHATGDPLTMDLDAHLPLGLAR